MVYPDLGDWNQHKPVEAEAGAVVIAENLAWSAIVTLTAGRVAFQTATLRPMVLATDGTIVLPAPCGGVTEVRVDGQVETRWQLEDNTVLQPLGDFVWTANGDLTQGPTEVGVTEIDYYPGWRPGRLLIWAAAELAMEFYRAASGDKKCRLPRNVTAVTRQGVTFEMTPSIFTEGRTGIHEIDVVLARYNPFGLTTTPVVATPESIASFRRVG